MPAHHAHPGRGPFPGTPVDDDSPAPETAAPGRSVVDIVNHLFARFDVDGDASITLSEWLGVVDPDGNDSSRSDSITAALTALDSDGSGALDTTEVTAAVGALDTDQDGLLSRTERKAAQGSDGTSSAVGQLLGGAGGHGGHGDHGGPRDTDPQAIDDVVSAFFTAFDSDGNGAVVLAELQAVLDGQGRHAGAPDRAAQALAAIDGNADGSLDRSELSAALTAADTDQDGTLSAAEVGHGPGDDVSLVGVLLCAIDDLPAG